MNAEAPPSSRRWRVVVVTPRYPPDVGGAESYAAWVARTVGSVPGGEVVVITTSPHGRGHHEVHDGVEVIRLGTWVTLSNTPLNPWWWFQVRRLLRRLRPDVINVHAPVPGLADLTTYAAGKVPVVMTYHAGSLVKGDGGRVDVLLRAYERFVLPRVFRRAAALIAVSPVSMVQATGRAVLVPPGVDVSTFRPPAGEQGGHRPPTILFVGRLETTSRWKGVHVLIDALALVAEHVPDVRLELAGDGDAVPWLRERAHAAGVEDRLVWHGSVGHDRLAELYRQAWVVALPSLTDSESFGMSLVEAMASGTPVVGSRVGGIPFVVRDGVDGVLVPPGDASALATALVSLVRDPDRGRAMGRAGREAAELRWSWTHQEHRMLAVLRSAAGPR